MLIQTGQALFHRIGRAGDHGYQISQNPGIDRGTDSSAEEGVVYAFLENDGPRTELDVGILPQQKIGSA